MKKTSVLHTNEIDRTIEKFKDFPYMFDNNEWICYERCKGIIRKLETNNKVLYDDYNLYIDYITDKLGL